MGTDRSFIYLCLNGDVLPEEIDDFVGIWHEDDDIKVECYEYLGMTREEYYLWATKPSILPSILSARKNGTTLDIELNKN